MNPLGFCILFVALSQNNKKVRLFFYFGDLTNYLAQYPKNLTKHFIKSNPNIDRNASTTAKYFVYIAKALKICYNNRVIPKLLAQKGEAYDLRSAKQVEA